MSLVTDRRKFLQTTAVTGLGYWVAGGVEAAVSKSPNDQIQLGCIGVGGKGQSDVQNASKYGKIYALCDVDIKIRDGMAKAYKTEHNFTDYREMLDKLGDRIDAGLTGPSSSPAGRSRRWGRPTCVSRFGRCRWPGWPDG